MQHGPYIITYRKNRRRGRTIGVWLTVAIVTIGLLAGGTALVRAHYEAAASDADLAQVPKAVVSADATPSIRSVAMEATEAPLPAAAATTSAPDGTGGSPATEPSSSDAVLRAALEFPGAPSVKQESISVLRPRNKYVAITLDDGYGFEPKLLTLLKKYDARCTVFVLGDWAQNNMKALRKLHRADFEIANHSWDHKDLTGLSDAQIRSQLLRTQRVISEVTGNQAPYMRPPMGATNARVRRVSSELGYKVIMWSRSFADTSPKASPERSYRSVMQRGGGIKPGDIIVGHMGSDDTYEALARILPELKAQGYEFVTVSELIADSKRNE